MKDKIRNLIIELECDLGILETQQRELNNKIAKIYLIKSQLEKILNDGE